MEGQKKEVFRKIKMIIFKNSDIFDDEQELESESNPMTADAELELDLGVDEASMYLILKDIKQEFDVEIPDEKLEEIKTVGDLVEFVYFSYFNKK